MLAAIVTVMFLLLMPTKSLFINSFPILKYLCNSQQAIHSFWSSFNSIDGFYLYLSGPALGLLNAVSSDGRRMQHLSGNQVILKQVIFFLKQRGQVG